MTVSVPKVIWLSLRPKSTAAASPTAAAALLTGCTGDQSSLDPAGPGAAAIAEIWWAMFWGSAVIFAGVVGLALFAALRRGDRPLPGAARSFLLGGGVVFPLVVVLALLAWGLRAGHDLLPLGEPPDLLRVEIVAHQWWWEVRYPQADGSVLYAANELHIPAGRPVDVSVATADVIHSFWVPRLGGKIDAVPGRVNRIRLLASEPGLFRGQCAEFCGAQHARMALHVVAHDDAGFRQRLDAMRAAVPDRPAVGRAAFGEQCAVCHSVDAAQRGSGIGPNLADLARRGWLGAGTLRNDPQALRDWLRRHQQLKPANRMPPHDHLDDATLDAVAAFLEGGR